MSNRFSRLRGFIRRPKVCTKGPPPPAIPVFPDDECDVDPDEFEVVETEPFTANYWADFPDLEIETQIDISFSDGRLSMDEPYVFQGRSPEEREVNQTLPVGTHSVEVYFDYESHHCVHTIEIVVNENP